MKQLFICLLIGVGLLTACSVESSDNGKLDGFWVMTVKEMGHTGWHSEDMSASGLTWSFQGNILELRDVNDKKANLIAKFKYTGDSLTVYDFRFLDRDNDDPVGEGEEYMRLDYVEPYGITGNVQTGFAVRELTSDRLYLVGASSRLQFRKY